MTRQNANTTTTGGLKLFWATCEHEIVVEKLQWKGAATTLAVGIQESSLNCGQFCVYLTGQASREIQWMARGSRK